MRLEILDNNDKVLTVHRLPEGLTLIGKSPGAQVHLPGEGVAPLHVAIKNDGPRPVVMDLGGPTRLRVNGKELLEFGLDGDVDSALLEIGNNRVRLARNRTGLNDVRRQPWAPVTDGKSKALVLRARIFVKGHPYDVVNTRSELVLPSDLGIASPFKTAWFKSGEVLAQLPAEWIKLGGRIQVGRDQIAKLEDWAQPVKLARDTIYRVFAGPYALELLCSAGTLSVGLGRLNPFPRELRKPASIATGITAAVFAIWLVLFMKPDAKVEEPYTVYARVNNVPIEKLPEPEQTAQSDLPQAGGGAGSDSKETAAPAVGAQTSAPVSKVAAALTGGLRNLIGNVVSQAKSSNAVVSETGVGVAAAAGAPGPAVGRLSSVGRGATGVAGASKLGNLAIAGSGKGFSGGSGVGLGSGAGAGIGNGVGQGIGRGGFRLVEEESIVDGGLDKSVIAAVIQNNLSQIKYCYERQLVAEPDLFGKVVASWVINAAGTVESTTVKQTTLNSSPVEKCMLAKIAGWKFPQPKNGTKVNVVYPFLFKSTN